jgi:hypothetical protein
MKNHKLGTLALKISLKHVAQVDVVRSAGDLKRRISVNTAMRIDHTEVTTKQLKIEKHPTHRRERTCKTLNMPHIPSFHMRLP